MPLLYLAQEQNGNWISKAVIEHVAKVLDMTVMHVYEVAHFYSMYHLKPVGKYVVQVCRTTPCWLRGSDHLAQTLKEELNVDFGETTNDGAFTIVEVECIGACDRAPAIRINDTRHENLSPNELKSLLQELREEHKKETSVTNTNKS